MTGKAHYYIIIFQISDAYSSGLERGTNKKQNLKITFYVE
jgi:hypothetical protein